MKTILEAIFQLFVMLYGYISIITILLFDSVVFGIFVKWINNLTLVRLYDMPEMTYIDGVAILFLIRIIVIMITSTNIRKTEEN
jgi:hypothetical protein